jgi:DNA-binding response OmpR family regulator
VDKKRILVVDDEPQMLDLIRIRLEANNYEVITSCDGKDGLQKAAEFMPDAIILDIMMPELDGGDVAAQIKSKKETRGIPIIFLSSLVEKQDEPIKRQVMGEDAYFIAKPFETQVLLSVINKVINS